MKAGVENLSGYSLDDVRVHYNSPKPAQLQALAYTQGTDIHVAPGQEEHLPHEAWHVVQQMQGRVKPTMQMKGVQINDDEGLEREAEEIGQRAARIGQNRGVMEKRDALNHSYLTSLIQRQGESLRELLFDPEYDEENDEDYVDYGLTGGTYDEVRRANRSYSGAAMDAQHLAVSSVFRGVHPHGSLPAVSVERSDHRAGHGYESDQVISSSGSGYVPNGWRTLQVESLTTFGPYIPIRQEVFDTFTTVYNHHGGHEDYMQQLFDGIDQAMDTGVQEGLITQDQADLIMDDLNDHWDILDRSFS